MPKFKPEKPQREAPPPWRVRMATLITHPKMPAVMKQDIRDCFDYIDHLKDVIKNNELEGKQKSHFRGHSSLAEMISTHIQAWRDALKTQMIDQRDTAFLKHELKALEEIEKACKIERGF